MRCQKALFIGGVKSGKSAHAEHYALLQASGSVIYLATAEIVDEEIRSRILRHREQRSERFVTLEEPLHLSTVIKAAKPDTAPVLIDCMTLWINNILYHGIDPTEITRQIDLLLTTDRPVTFVLNDVGSGVIADNPLARQYVDLSGIAAQQLATGCDHVFHCLAGIATTIKPEQNGCR